jgi:outer membrane protein
MVEERRPVRARLLTGVMKIRAAALVTLAVLLAAPAAAEDLLQVYREAQRYDAVFSAARNSLVAGREKFPQGRALLLPNVTLTANATRQQIDSEAHDASLAPFVNTERYAYTRGYTLTFSQPVLRLQNVAQYAQSEYQVKQAEATFGQAAQDLILRVAQAYFDVLAAQDSLGLVRAQKAAISEQLAQAKRNFEVGTATITDTHEAQARFDLSSAQEIAAQNDLENRRSALQQITGKEYAELKPLRADVKLAQPNPNDMQSWVDLAEKQGFPVQAADALREIAALELKRNYAAHLPTVDFIASHQYANQTGTVTSAVGNDLRINTIGFQLSMPLFLGGALFSRDREAAALSLKSRDDLDNARRNAALTTRQSYLAVINGIAQVGALEQARVSSQSALDSNKLGYEVGVRINIDVLNAQQQLYSTVRDLSVARYNIITNLLKLKAAAGSLIEQDLEDVNRALAP